MDKPLDEKALLSEWIGRGKTAQQTLDLKSREAAKGHDWVVAHEVIHCDKLVKLGRYLEATQEGESKPVAWSYRQLIQDSMGGWENRISSRNPRNVSWINPSDLENVIPLYTAPPSFAAVQADNERLREENERLRTFAESFRFSVNEDAFYKDVSLHLISPHSLGIRLQNDSSKSWLFKDVETRRLAALAGQEKKE